MKVQPWNRKETHLKAMKILREKYAAGYEVKKDEYPRIDPKKESKAMQNVSYA